MAEIEISGTVDKGVEKLPPHEDVKKIQTKVTCYLTFDDGPKSNTGEILDMLQGPDKTIATFFVTGKNMDTTKTRARQHELTTRIINEGHVLGNHGYKHYPARPCEYRNTLCYKALKKTNNTPAGVRENFDQNQEYFEELFSDPKNKGKAFPKFKAARLPGNGSFEPKYVEMIVKKVKLPHVGWDVEFAPEELTIKPDGLRHINEKNWQGVKGVSSTTKDPLKAGSIILLHDSHWKGMKKKEFKALLKKLNEQCVFKLLTPLPKGHRAIRNSQ